MQEQITNDFFGCVRFDDPHSHDRGWAARAGQKAFRIRGTEDLSSNTLWLTNLSYNLMYDSGFADHARFRRGDFLSENFCKPTRACGDNGPEWVPYDLVSMLGIQGDDWKTQVERVATLFDRVMRLSAKFLNLNDISKNSLSLCIRDILFPPDAILDEKVASGLKESCVTFTKCELRPALEDHARHIALTLPRLAHALKLAALPAPAGAWKAIPAAKLPAPDEVAAWLSENKSPLLARLTVEKMDPEVNPLINFGTGRGARRWAVTQELEYLARYGQVRLHEVFQPERVDPIPKLKSVIAQFEPVHELSVSVGVFWENLWRSLTVNLPPKVHIRKGRPSFNALAPYVRALDRALLLEEVIWLQQQGLSVVSYGKGKITISTALENPALAQKLEKRALIPPFLDVAKSDMAVNSPVELFKAFYMTGDRANLEMADSHIVESLCGGGA